MATPEDVQKLAKLARISIPEAELSTFAAEFDGILAYVGRLEELSLPSHAERSVPVVRNVMRDDGHPHETGAFTEALTAQFPRRDGDALSVKQIISYD